MTKSLNFCLSEKMFISPALIKDNLLHRILKFFFSFNTKYFTLLSCLHDFSKSDAIVNLFPPYVKCFFFLLASLKIFTLFPLSKNLNVLCLGLDILIFSLVGVL